MHHVAVDHTGHILGHGTHDLTDMIAPYLGASIRSFPVRPDGLRVGNHLGDDGIVRRPQDDHRGPETRESRIEQVLESSVMNLESPGFRELSDYGTRLQARLVHNRIQMMTAAVVLPEDAEGVHVVDDDANWRVFQREMRIPATVFYHNARRSEWDSLSPPIIQAFYRTKIENGVYVPVAVDFPEFSSVSLNDCRQAWGFVGMHGLSSSDSTH